MTTSETPKSKHRCFECRKKIPLAMRGSPCKCGHEFCNAHRLPETHNCGFNQRSEHLAKSAQTIEQMKCVASKVEKI